MKKLLLIIVLLASATCYAIPHKFQPTATFETCFTPGNQCTDDVVELINSAKKQILVQAYYLTSENIILALVQAKNSGVDIHVILDKSQLNNHYIDLLKQSNIDIRIDYCPKIAHNKVIIVDNYRILTGSFNFTNNAQFKNAENILIINDMNLAESYVVNFFDRLEVSQPITKYKRK